MPTSNASLAMHSTRNFVPIFRLLEFKQDLSEKTLNKDASEVIQDGLSLMLAMDSEAPKPKLGTNPLFPQTSENRHLDDRDVWKIFRLDYRGHGSLKITDEAFYPMDMEKLGMLSSSKFNIKLTSAKSSIEA